MLSGDKQETVDCFGPAYGNMLYISKLTEEGRIAAFSGGSINNSP